LHIGRQREQIHYLDYTSAAHSVPSRNVSEVVHQFLVHEVFELYGKMNRVKDRLNGLLQTIVFVWFSEEEKGAGPVLAYGRDGEPCVTLCENSVCPKGLPVAWAGIRRDRSVA
jgi:hypothetical protein